VEVFGIDDRREGTTAARALCKDDEKNPCWCLVGRVFNVSLFCIRSMKKAGRKYIEMPRT